MYAEEIIDPRPYRAPLNPAFVRKALANRKAKERAEIALAAAEARKAARRKARMTEAEAAARIEAARAELSNQKIVVYRVDADRFQHAYSQIEARALRLFRITRAELRSNRRDRDLVFARQFVMYWTARLTQHSLPLIGRLMGGRDHTTILHGRHAYAEKRSRMGRSLRLARKHLDRET